MPPVSQEHSDPDLEILLGPTLPVEKAARSRSKRVPQSSHPASSLAVHALLGQRLELNPGCTRCRLCETSAAGAVKRICVGGVGPSPATIMLIGEALGSEEVLQSQPFVGVAGRVLTECLTEAGLLRETVYLTNVVKCRPPENRAPTPKEIAACLPYLMQEIEAVKPRLIVLVGSTALHTFLEPLSITKVHGQVFTVEGFECQFIPIFHPSYVLRKAEDSTVRKKFIDDLVAVRRFALTGTTERERQPTNYVLIQRLDDFGELMGRLHQADVVDFDLETTGNDPKQDKIISIAFSIREREAFVVPMQVDGKPYWGAEERLVIEGLKGFFESEVPKCAHAGSLIDLPFLHALGIIVNHYDYDGLVMDYLLDENKPEEKRGLKELAWDYTDLGGYETELEGWKRKVGVPRGEWDVSRIPFEVLWRYNAADADVLGRCRRAMDQKLREQDLLALFHRILMPLVITLCEMEAVGIRVDVEALRSTRKEYEEIVDELEAQLASHPVVLQAKRQFDLDAINFRSTAHLRKLLFDLLKLTPVKHSPKTKVPSTSKDVLEALAHFHELPKLILQARQHARLASYYGEEFERHIGADGRIRTRYLIHGTRTGRLSSRHPNLQNIPRIEQDETTGEEAVKSRARHIFVAEPGCLLVEADYAQIEFRLLANYSQDAQMLWDIEHHVDIHRQNAALVYGKLAEDVTKQERQDAKALTYALIYGASAYRIAELFHINLETAQQIIDKLFAKYPGAKRYHETMKAFCRRHGFVTNPFGRRRRLPGILATDQELRGHAEREAINAPIQSLASDLLFVAMNRLHLAFKAERPDAHLVLTVHDSITSEVPESNIQQAIQIIRREMLKPVPGVTVPLEVEMKVGRTLGQMAAEEGRTNGSDDE